LIDDWIKVGKKLLEKKVSNVETNQHRGFINFWNCLNERNYIVVLVLNDLKTICTRMENSNGEMNADTYLKRRWKILVIWKASLVHIRKNKMYFFAYFLRFEKRNHFSIRALFNQENSAWKLYFYYNTMRSGWFPPKN
jgi:hypothetical protein